MTTVDILRPASSAFDSSRASDAVRGILTAQRAHHAAAQRRLARASPTHRVAAIMTLIMTGMVVAITTTPDPLWWKLHFSELGTFQAFSSYIFNATLIVAGVAIVAFARYFRRELGAHLTRSGSRRRSPAVVSMLIGSIGLHLAFVGVIPVNTLTFLHDRAATGLVFSFLALLITTPAMLRGLGRALAAITIPAALLLVGGGTAMVMSVINLAAYELLGFAVMFTWVLMFVACLGRHAKMHEGERTHTASAEAVQDAEKPARGVSRSRIRVTGAAHRPATHLVRGVGRRRGVFVSDSARRRFGNAAETYTIETTPRLASPRMMTRRSRIPLTGPVRRTQLRTPNPAILID